MDPVHALVLGIVQGATEFLPVSSSGHLVLVPWLLGWPAPGLAFDAFLHLGTIVAVIAYFWRDMLSLAGAWLRSLRDRSLADSPPRKVAWLILLGTVPAALAGLLLEAFFEGLFANPSAVGLFLLVTATLLAVSEHRSRQEQQADEMTWLDGLLVGIGQACAIAPGLSRSGTTIAAGLWRGLTRPVAARYSFLLSVPIVIGAGLLQARKLLSGLDTHWLPLTLGFLASAVVGYLCIHFLLTFLQRGRLYGFAVYCAAAGAITLALVALGWSGL
jgi:undecaprenyl-diphosphatase